MLAVLDIVCFLTAALWLADMAERAGLARRAAAAIARAARGSAVRLYWLTCAACAAATATVSLDGAVVILVPLVGALAGDDARLRRVLLLGTVAVANAFSLAVPQGNPTNLVVMHALDLAPGAYIAHLALPALIATLVCAVAVAPRSSSGQVAVVGRPLDARWTRAERVAAVALATAAIAGAVAPWLGLSPLWAVVAVAALTLPVAALAGLERTPLVVPWRIGLQIAALAAVVSLLPAISVGAASLPAALALGLGAAALAGLVNNLPASVALAGVLRAPGLGAYATLAGLSVGALATPRGSVATMIAFRRAGTPRRSRLAPVAVAATLSAVAVLWLLG